MVVEKETVFRQQKTDATSQTIRDDPPADRRWVVKELRDAHRCSGPTGGVSHHVHEARRNYQTYRVDSDYYL